MNEIEPLADSVDVAAVRLGVCRSVIYMEIKAGRLRAVKARGRTLIRRDAQIDWLNNLPAMAAGNAA